MRRPSLKILSDLSFSGAQAALNKLSGLLVFFLLSNTLDKSLFGYFNWAIACVTVLYTIAGLGTDQLIVKKIAGGEDEGRFTGVYFLHVFVSGFCILLLVFIAFFIGIFPDRTQQQVFGWLCLSQCLLYFSMPFKQTANGEEAYGLLFVMSSIANMVRALLLIGLLLKGPVSLMVVLRIYAIAAMLEWVTGLCLYRFRLQKRILISRSWQKYRAFLIETLPLVGTTVGNIALARLDWIMLGMLATTSLVADYSLAYRVFELSTLPAWVIAPVALPRITKMFMHQHRSAETGYRQIRPVIWWQMLPAVLLAGIIYAGAPQLVRLLGGNTYLAQSTRILQVLVISMPLMYLNNVFWCMAFARGHNLVIMYGTLLTCLVNLVANCCWIHYFGAVGAAWAFVLAITIQTAYYFITASMPDSKRICAGILLLYGIAGGAMLVSRWLLVHWAAQIGGLIFLYLVFFLVIAAIAGKRFFLLLRFVWPEPI